MNIGDIIIGALTAFALLFALMVMNKNKDGDSSCSGDCANCVKGCENSSIKKDK